MRTNMTRLVALLLALLMLAGTLALVSCGDATEQPPEDETPEQQPPDDGAIEEDPRIPLDYLPTDTYGGEQINILEWTVDDHVPGDTWVPWEEIDVDLGDGDPINNVIYDRNGVVEETYDVVIPKEYLSINGSPAYTTAFRANETTGDQAYQMITLRTTNILSLCMENLMTNMFELPNLHTDMPWWNADSVVSYTMGDALFFAAPEMLLRDKGATAAMYYNQVIADNEGIEDLYALVAAGEWTQEVMIELSENVTADMDGDDLVSSAEDMYGLAGSKRSIPFHMYAGTGNKLAQINDEGYLELNFGDDESIMMWQDMLDYVMYSDYYTENMKDSALIPSDFNFFTSDHALFYIDMVKTAMRLRNMESNYGVLPLPKYDEYQDEYASLVWMHHDCVLGIPASCTNTDVISVVLEHMSYISYYDVYPVFYDTIILGKSARDAQSKEMLELIFRTRSFDPGQYWLDSVLGSTLLTLFEKGQKNISSVWASVTIQTETALEEFNEKVDELR